MVITCFSIIGSITLFSYYVIQTLYIYIYTSCNFVFRDASGGSLSYKQVFRRDVQRNVQSSFILKKPVLTSPDQCSLEKFFSITFWDCIHSFNGKHFDR